MMPNSKIDVSSELYGVRQALATGIHSKHSTMIKTPIGSQETALKSRSNW